MGFELRLNTPRLSPLPEDKWDGEILEILDKSKMNGRVLNIFRTLARHPKLLKRWMVFANHIMLKSSLSARDREILILRIGWLCRAEYEWGQHVLIGLEAGLTPGEIERIKTGAQSSGWDDRDKLLIMAVDELHSDSFISDETWNKLAKIYDDEQLIDLVFTVGQYNLVSMALNTLGVQLDEGVPGFDNQ